MTTTTQAQEDGYVECSECGHRLEGHDAEGCQEVDGCTCGESWTHRQVQAVRVREGLPARWSEE